MSIHRVARDVFCVEGTAVNWVLVREGRDLTLIDAGYPGDVEALLASIASIGHRPEDVRAVLVTHAHVDHVGSLNHLHEQFGTPALMHPDEVPNATGERHESATVGSGTDEHHTPRRLVWAERRAQHLDFGRLRPRHLFDPAVSEDAANPGGVDVNGGRRRPIPCPTTLVAKHADHHGGGAHKHRQHHQHQRRHQSSTSSRGGAPAAASLSGV